jgi:hypothetical protein
MPTLIGNYRKSYVENEIKASISILQNALRLSIVDNGEPQYWEIDNLDYEVFNKYFAKYLKIVKTCNSSEMGDENSGICYTSPIKTIDGSRTVQIDGFYQYKYLLSNGIAILYRQGETVSTTARRGMFAIILPTNRKNLVFGRDVFTLNLIVEEDKNRHYLTSVYDYNGDSSSFCNTSRNNMISYCRSGVMGSAGYATGIFCTAMLECNSWKIPSDYPAKF